MLNLDLPKEALTTAFCKLTNIMQGKEIKEKHINCIRSIIRLATHDGNYLKGSWKSVLEIISKIDYYHMTVSGSRSELEAFFSDVRNRKKLQQTNNQANIEKEILVEKNNMEKIGREINQDDYEIIFSKTLIIDNETLIDFIKSLCQISREELASKDSPRIFSLQKLVEVAELNIKRVRIIWSRIWSIISEHLTQVGSNTSPNIAEKAIDSLRQLAKKLLLKDEISVYKFQMEFLKPFENILINNINSYSTKEYVLTCITNLVLAEASCIKSGWKIIFNIFSLASDDNTDQDLNKKTFETLVKVFNNHFSQIKDNFNEFTHCLKKFSDNYPEECINIYKNSYVLLDDSSYVNSLLLCLGSLIRNERENIRNISCSAFFYIVKKIAESTINDSEENETNDSFHSGSHKDIKVTQNSKRNFSKNTVSSIGFNFNEDYNREFNNGKNENNDHIELSGGDKSLNPKLEGGNYSNDYNIRNTVKIDYANFSHNLKYIIPINLNNSNFKFSNSFNNTSNDNLFSIPKITFDSEYWKNMFKNIFRPIIDDLISIKLPVTLEIFLIDLNDIFMCFYDKLDYLLDNYLNILIYIISCDNENTALAGFEALKILIDKLGSSLSRRINEKFWEKIIKTISEIFNNTIQVDFLNLDINNFENPEFQGVYQDIVYKNLIFCIIQHHLIDLSDNLIEKQYEKLNYNQLNILIECLRKSWELAYNFNIEFNLRQLISYNFMSDLNNVAALFKQQQDGCFILFKALNKILENVTDSNKEIKENAVEKIIENSKIILTHFIDRINYNEEDNYLYNENERLMNNMVPVILECVFKSLERIEFMEKINHKNVFTEILIQLITCNNLEIRIKVKNLLSQIFYNYKINRIDK